MKTRKFSLAQILTFVLAFVLMFAMAVPAFASSGVGPDNPDGKTLIKVLPSEGANTKFPDRFQAYSIFTGTVLPTTAGSTESNPIDPSQGGVALVDLQWSNDFKDVAKDFIEYLTTADIKSGEQVPFRNLDVPADNTAAQSSEIATQVAKILEKYASDSEFVITFAKAVYTFINSKSITGTTSKWFTKPDTANEGYWYFEVDNPGYYLIIDNYDTLRAKALEDAGGSGEDASDEYPAEVGGFILAVLGNQFVNMKSKTPTVEKDIVIDEAGNTSKGDTVNFGDEVTFKLTGTLPENYDQFDTFTYTFRDNLSEGLTFEDGSLQVEAVKGSETVVIPQSIGGTVNYDAVKPAPDETKGGTSFEVTFPDLKNLKVSKKGEEGATEPLKIDEYSQIIVTYKAKVNKDAAVIGSDGNPNTVDLQFSNNPFGEGKGTTTEKQVYVYSFGLDVTKYGDDAPDKTLDGAVFVLSRKSDGYFAQFGAAPADGVASNKAPQKLTGWVESKSDATRLTTDNNGQIYVSGLDVGTYTLTEEVAPDGYNLMKPLEITIKAEFYDNGKLKSVSKQVAGVDASPVVYSAATDEAAGGVFSSGLLPIDPVNNKAPVLPGTGGIGLVIFYVLGGLLLVGAATYIIVSGRKKSKQQQQ